jgi:hypothetical protein
LTIIRSPSASHGAGCAGDDPVAMTMRGARMVSASPTCSVWSSINPGVATNLVGRGKRFDVIDDKSGEAVSLGLDAIHHRLAVDGDRPRRPDAERRETRESVRGFRPPRSELCSACIRRARTSCRRGRPRSQRALSGRLDGPVCGKSCGAGTYDGDVGVKDLHGARLLPRRKVGYKP